ncbi:FAD-dependent oxidoreductase, partial [Achromobacter dolens]
PVDGIANPLKLLRALHMSFAQRAVDYLPRCPAKQIRQRDGVFEVTTPTGTVRARKLVLASGLSNKALGEQVGLT